MQCFITVLNLKSVLNINAKRGNLSQNLRNSLPCTISIVKDNIPQDRGSVVSECGRWEIAAVSE